MAATRFVAPACRRFLETHGFRVGIACADCYLARMLGALTMFAQIVTPQSSNNNSLSPTRCSARKTAGGLRRRAVELSLVNDPRRWRGHMLVAAHCRQSPFVDTRNGGKGLPTPPVAGRRPPT